MRTEPVYDHVAVVNGVSYVFASVEYPVDEPPEELVIGGVRYVRADDDEK